MFRKISDSLFKRFKRKRIYKTTSFHIEDIPIEVVHKAVRNLHLIIRQPDGRVRLTVHYRTTQNDIRKFLMEKLPWIKKHRSQILSLPAKTANRYLTGETHPFLGSPSTLFVFEKTGRSRVELKADNTLALYVKPSCPTSERKKVLENWYRSELSERIPPLLQKWESIIGVKASKWGIRRMTTRWGSCNTRNKNIWLSLELIKKPPEYLECILVHELLHIIENNHGPRFKALMDRYVPEWRQLRKKLNSRNGGTD